MSLPPKVDLKALQGALKAYRVVEAKNVDGIVFFTLQHKSEYKEVFSKLKHNNVLYDALENNRAIRCRIVAGQIVEVL